MESFGGDSCGKKMSSSRLKATITNVGDLHCFRRMRSNNMDRISRIACKQKPMANIFFQPYKVFENLLYLDDGW